MDEVLYRRGSAKLRLSEDILTATQSPAAAAAAADGVAATDAAPLRTVQAFDCVAMLASDPQETGSARRQEMPEEQRKQLAASLQFGAAALAAADSSSSSSSSQETNPLASLPIEQILSQAFAADAAATAAPPITPAAAAAAAAAAGSVLSSRSVSLDVSSPPLSPLVSVNEEGVCKLGKTEEQEKTEETAGGCQDSIYLFEDKDFTPFVRGARWPEGDADAAAVASLAAAAAAAAPSGEDPGSNQEASPSRLSLPPPPVSFPVASCVRSPLGCMFTSGVYVHLWGVRSPLGCTFTFLFF